MYSSTAINYSFDVFDLNLSISIFCYFLLPLLHSLNTCTNELLCRVASQTVLCERKLHHGRRFNSYFIDYVTEKSLMPVIGKMLDVSQGQSLVYCPYVKLLSTRPVDYLESWLVDRDAAVEFFFNILFSLIVLERRQSSLQSISSTLVNTHLNSLDG